MTLLTLAALTGCNDDEAQGGSDNTPVEAALSLSVLPGSSGATRMGGDVVQVSGNFRGLQSLRAIPFATQGKITINDQPLSLDTRFIRSEEYRKTSTCFYYFETFSLAAGVSSFLVYGQAQTAVTADGSPQDKPRNGSLVATFLGDASPARISFAPDPIWASTEAPPAGNTMAVCLTDVANTQVSDQGNNIYTWRYAPDSQLRVFYQNFIGQVGDNNALIASSTANVEYYLKDLRVKIAALTFGAGTINAQLRQAIIDAIDKNLKLLPADYPASVNLPAGAAAVRWDGTRFKTEATTTTLANISSLSRYAYPAELFYYANSRIKTTTLDAPHDYYSSESNWDTVLNQYEYDNGTVTNNTTAVAIKEPLQYAVGCLQLSFNSFNGTLRDAAGRNITPGTTSFPLTGIIVGSQRPVGFDFVPTSNSDVDTRFIYDSYPVNANGQQLHIGQGGTATTNTLVLQTWDGEKVTLILEFQNNSSTTFTGLNGVVYPGTRFYLAGSVEPKAAPQADYEKRAFTKDYITHVGITVASLAKAYNVMPDILAPHLEIGVSLTPQWIMAKPTNVEL